MKTPDRVAALCKARTTLRNRDRRIARMKKKLDAMTTNNGVQVESEVQEEIESVIENHRPEIEALPGSDFRRVFWDQQG